MLTALLLLIAGLAPAPPEHPTICVNTLNKSCTVYTKISDFWGDDLCEYINTFGTPETIWKIGPGTFYCTVPVIYRSSFYSINGDGKNKTFIRGDARPGAPGLK